MNDNNNLQEQINQINNKLDLVLIEAKNLRLKREETEDLLSDISIIGKDIFNNTVQELDKAGVELDSDALRNILIGFIRNIGNFNEMLEMFESANDFMKDIIPIINQIGHDTIAKFVEFEKKGYLEFFNEFITITDKIVGNYTKDDIKLLSDNIVTILEIFKNVTQPEMLDLANNTLTSIKDVDTQNIPEYSLWKTFKEMKSPEMKKGIGFMITFMKKFSSTLNKKEQ